MDGNYFKLKQIFNFFLKNILRFYFRFLLSLFLRTIIILTSKFKHKDNNFTHNNQNYIIILYGGIGDLMMMSNLANNLSKNNEVTLFIDKKLNFMKNVFEKCEVIEYSSNNVIEAIKKIRKNSKDKIFLSWSSSVELMILYLISKSNSYLGFVGTYSKVFFKNKFHLNKKLNRYQIYNELYKLISKNNLDDYINDYKYRHKNKYDRYIIIHPHKTNYWGDVSIKNIEWIKFIRLILENTNLNIILVGSKKEIEKVTWIKQNLQLNKRIFDLTGKTNFQELNLLLKDSYALVTGDTGIMHLANRFKIKIFSVFTFSDHKVYATQNNTTVIYKKNIKCQPCVSTSKDGSDNYPPVCFNNFACSDSIKSIDIFNEFYRFYLSNESK